MLCAYALFNDLTGNFWKINGHRSYRKYKTKHDSKIEVLSLKQLIIMDYREKKERKEKKKHRLEKEFSNIEVSFPFFFNFFFFFSSFANYRIGKKRRKTERWNKRRNVATRPSLCFLGCCTRKERQRARGIGVRRERKLYPLKMRK